MAERKRLSPDQERSRQPDQRLSERAQPLARAGDRVICASADLADRGDGVRFEVELKGETVPAFAIRHGGRVYAYVNRCAHIAMELDWNEGKFFDAAGEYLICSTHGALYAPQSGACRGGPCRGAKLVGLDVYEAEGTVYMTMKG
jgi:nitrite reductase/ring-hydroxylating ferredoxin subunit